MRLMARDVEVADAEREVDRVEIFERRRQERQVEREEEQRERRRRQSRAKRSPRPRLGARSAFASRGACATTGVPGHAAAESALR